MHVRLSGILRTSLFFCCFCIFSFTGIAQNTSTGVSLYTPYTSISVSPGQTINYAITVINNSNSIRNVDVSVLGIPKGWAYTLMSGSWKISKISVLPKKQEALSLQVMVPLKVNKGSYRFEARAKGFAVLPLEVVISKQGSYKTAFSSNQSNLEGPASTTFTFNARLMNQTSDTQFYALNAEAPPGWNVAFKVSFKQVASVSVEPGRTQSMTITVNPPDQVPAGTYKIPVLAVSSNTSADFEMEVVISGSYGMQLTTPSGLLSTDITAGDEKRLQLSVINTGSATLKNISMSFAAPTNWDVTFDPKQIDMLAPGQTAQVFVTIKADKDAIAGDYVTDLTAKTAEISSKAEFRISVRTSMLWGWVGIIIILLAIGCVYYLFRKYGRR